MQEMEIVFTKVGFDRQFFFIVCVMSDEDKAQFGITDDDDHYWVYDGNTRLAALEKFPEVDEIPCKVVNLPEGTTCSLT